MEQKPEQTATEQQAQTAPGVKQNLISGNDVNLQELGAKYGIDFNSMNEKDMKALLLRQDGACDSEADLRR